MPSSGHTLASILKLQLSEFEHFLLLKTLSSSGFEPQSASRKAESLPLSYHVMLLQTLVLELYIRIYSPFCICGYSRVLMAFSSSLQSLRIILLCREHSYVMLLVTGACGHLPCIAKSHRQSSKSPYQSFGRILKTDHSAYTYSRTL